MDAGGCNTAECCFQKCHWVALISTWRGFGDAARIGEAPVGGTGATRYRLQMLTQGKLRRRFTEMFD